MGPTLLPTSYPGEAAYRQGEAGMKAITLGGGFGRWIGEETQVKPKPLMEIGGKPILWHITKIHSTYGTNAFTICLGHKACMIKRLFALV